MRSLSPSAFAPVPREGAVPDGAVPDGAVPDGAVPGGFIGGVVSASRAT